MMNLMASDAVYDRYYLYKNNNKYYLTPREAQCAYLVMHKIKHKIIAEILQLSIRTIEFYIHNIRMRFAELPCSNLAKWLHATDFSELYKKDDIFNTHQLARIAQSQYL